MNKLETTVREFIANVTAELQDAEVMSPLDACISNEVETEAKQVDWKNGDDCWYINDCDATYSYVGSHPKKDGHYVFSDNDGISFVGEGYLSRVKPESPQDKANREREDAVKAMPSDLDYEQLFWNIDSIYNRRNMTDSVRMDIKMELASIINEHNSSLYDAGYRKGE